MFNPRKTVALVSLVGLIMIAYVGPAAGVGPEGEGEHCVVRVLDQKPSGELVLSDSTCFETFAQAAFAASSGTVRLDPTISPGDLANAGEVATLLSTFTLGVHYDGYSGSGSSISVVGSSCSGGYWNTPSTWDNRISSTWNGCYRVTHHDLPGKGGASRSTIGAGSIHNLVYPLNNAAESVSYWSG
jgi:hypothetical protein